MDDRAISDVIGYVLVVSLIVSTLGVVYVAGFGGLEDARAAEQINNAERAFDVLGENLADIHRHGAPSRKTEIKIYDATLSLGEPTTIQVEVEDITDGAGNRIVYEANTRPLVYSAKSPSKIVYENGAVIRSDRGGALLRRGPPFLIEEDRTVIGYVVLTAANGASTSVGGDSTVLVRTVRSGQSTLVQDQTDPEVTLTIQTSTARAAIWQEYVNERADWSASDWNDGDSVPCETTDLGGGRSEVTCTFQPNEFYLTSTGLKTELIT